MTAMLFVPCGGSLHAIAGDVSSPSHVYFDGMAPFDGKDGEVTVNVATCTPGAGSMFVVDAGVVSFFEQPATCAVSSAAVRTCSLYMNRTLSLRGELSCL